MQLLWIHNKYFSPLGKKNSTWRRHVLLLRYLRSVKNYEW